MKYPPLTNEILRMPRSSSPRTSSTRASWTASSGSTESKVTTYRISLTSPSVTPATVIASAGLFDLVGLEFYLPTGMLMRKYVNKRINIIL